MQNDVRKVYTGTMKKNIAQQMTASIDATGFIFDQETFRSCIAKLRAMFPGEEHVIEIYLVGEGMHPDLAATIAMTYF